MIELILSLDLATGEVGAEIGRFTGKSALRFRLTGCDTLGKSCSWLIVGSLRPGNENSDSLLALTGVFSRTKGSSSPGWSGRLIKITGFLGLESLTGVGWWVPKFSSNLNTPAHSATCREGSLAGLKGLAAFKAVLVVLPVIDGRELLFFTLSLPHTRGRVLEWVLVVDLLAFSLLD